MKTTTSHPVFNIFAIIAIVFILYVLKPIIMPLIIAAIFGVLIFPTQKFFEKKWRCNRLFATLFSMTMIFTITAAIVSVIYFQLNNLSNNGENYTTKITQVYYNSVMYFEDTFNIPKRNSLANKDLKIENLIKGNFNKIGELLAESGSLISDIILIPIYLFFFLYYRRFFRVFSYKLFKTSSKSFVNATIKKIYNIQQNYLIGLIKVIFIVGSLNTIGLLILGIDNAIFFGFFAAVLLLIPYIGIIVGSLIPAVIALATKDTAWYAFGVIIIFGFIQFLEGNFITPKITGSKVSVNPFIAILSLIIFSMLWGISGMIVALPIVASLKVIFDQSKSLRAYGFLIGEPVDRLLQSEAQNRLKIWRKIRTNQNTKNYERK